MEVVLSYLVSLRPARDRGDLDRERAGETVLTMGRVVDILLWTKWVGAAASLVCGWGGRAPLRAGGFCGVRRKRLGSKARA